MSRVDDEDLRHMVREKLSEMRKIAKEEGCAPVGNAEMFTKDFPYWKIQHHQFHYARGWVLGIADSCDATVAQLLKDLCLS